MLGAEEYFDSVALLVEERLLTEPTDGTACMKPCEISQFYSVILQSSNPTGI